MPKLKTSKAAAKRFKVSRKGTVRHRPVNMDHYNSKDDGNTRRQKRTDKTLSDKDSKNMRKLMPYL
ncbi:MAG: 50S ribosomal protein L35 [Parcubacteria group bacterium]